MTSNGKRTQLTAKQEAFCRFVFQGLPQRDAYLKAGYSGRLGLAVIDVKASELVHHGKVSVRLADLRAKAESDAVGTVIERKKLLTEVYRATVANFVDENGNLDIASKTQLNTPAVAEVRTERTIAGIKTTLKLRDPIAAIAEQNKMERIGAENTPATNVNIVFVVGKGYRELPSLIEGNNDHSD